MRIPTAYVYVAAGVMAGFLAVATLCLLGLVVAES